MTAPAFEQSAATPTRDPVAVIRARAAADIKQLRALARSAATDGLPKAELRSANARAAALRVLDHARRLSTLRPFASNGLCSSEMAG